MATLVVFVGGTAISSTDVNTNFSALNSEIATLAAGPTIAGTLTLSGTGPRLKLTATDAQILVGSGSDPGWTKPAMHLLDSAANAAIWTDAATLSLAVNMYYSTVEKAHASGFGCRIKLTTDPQLNFQTGDNPGIDTAITFVTRLRIDANNTAAETGLLVSVAGAAPQRVSIGAADSAGAGFRALRVTNA